MVSVFMSRRGCAADGQVRSNIRKVCALMFTGLFSAASR